MNVYRNHYRLSVARQALAAVRTLRESNAPNWRERVAYALSRAGEMRRTSWQTWDYTVTIWVCQCCLLSEANGECCDSDSHRGDYMIPLSAIDPNDTLVMGMRREEHDSDCERRNPDTSGLAECDCEQKEFSSVQCGGCDSWLAGYRYAMTLFVGDRRPRVSLVKAA